LVSGFALIFRHLMGVGPGTQFVEVAALHQQQLGQPPGGIPVAGIGPGARRPLSAFGPGLGQYSFTAADRLAALTDDVHLGQSSRAMMLPSQEPGAPSHGRPEVLPAAADPGSRGWWRLVKLPGQRG
jgi:hypothetical protein